MAAFLSLSDGTRRGGVVGRKYSPFPCASQKARLGGGEK